MATKAIGTLGSVPSITVGNKTFTDLTNLVILKVRVTGGNYNVFKRIKNGTAGSTPADYQVPSGKTFVIEAIKYIASGTTTLGGMGIIYGDNAIANTTTQPTNGVWAVSQQVGGGTAFMDNLPLLNLEWVELSMSIPIPALKYPHISTGASQEFLGFVYGYEI